MAKGFLRSGAKFWEDSDYARKAYVEGPPDAAVIASVEAALKVKLPVSYLSLMRTQNGGIPRDRCFPTKVRTSWAEDHIAIEGFMGIGWKKSHSLCGELGSAFMRDEWGYPGTGICICTCPSAGHDMVMLDYHACGPTGEPSVVHVDQEANFRVTFLAKDFETFVRGLVNEKVYDTSSKDLKKALLVIEKGAFSPLLSTLVSHPGAQGFERIIRTLFRQLAVKKKVFALHADEASTFLYDVQFYLYTLSNAVRSRDEYLEEYPEIIALADGEFSTRGYAPGFIEKWIDARLSAGEIVTNSAGHLEFSEPFLKAFHLKAKSVC